MTKLGMAHGEMGRRPTILGDPRQVTAAIIVTACAGLGLAILLGCWARSLKHEEWLELRDPATNASLEPSQ